MGEVLKFQKPVNPKKCHALTILRDVKKRIDRGLTVGIGLVEEMRDGRVTVIHQFIEPSGVILLAGADILKDRIKTELGVK